MPLQIQGNSGTVAEVEQGTRALRTVLRPNDYGSLGIYSIAQASGVMSAGLTANSPIFSFRWTDATRFCLLRRVLFSAGAIAAFTAGVANFQLFAARSFTASDTNGTAITPTGNVGKLRTASMGTSLVGDVRIASNTTLGVGTRTLDANPLGSISVGVLATAGQPLVNPGSVLFDTQPGEHPDVMAQNEGWVIQANVPATGTWTFSVWAIWEELAGY